MALTFDANEHMYGKLIWEIEITFCETLHKRAIISQQFYFQNCECRFEYFIYNSNGDGPFHEVHMVSTSGQKLPQPFTFTSYIKIGNDPVMFSTREIPPLTSDIKVIDEVYSSTNFYFQSSGMKEIVMIFHDELGLTLGLASKIGLTSAIVPEFWNGVDHLSVTDQFKNNSFSAEKPAQNAEIKEKTVVPGLKGVDRLLQDLKAMYLEVQSSDAILKVKNWEFPVHKAILRARSIVFDAMFGHDMAEKRTNLADIPDCSAEAFEILLRYVYTGTCGDSVSTDNVFDLYYAADKYYIDDLKEICVEFIKTHIVCADNVFDLYYAADQYCNMDDLKEICVEFLKMILSVDTFCDIITLALKHNKSELLEAGARFFFDNIRKIIKTVSWQLFFEANALQINELYIKALNL